MTRILKSEHVWLYCKKCKKTTEHVVYLKENRTEEIKKCIECAHHDPHLYPLYGRQPTEFKPHVIDEQKPQQFGRFVA